MTTQQTLIKIMNQTFINHKGMLIEKIIGGYKWNEKKYSSLQELDNHINTLGKELKINEK